MLLTSTTACVEQAVELCAQLGPLGPYLFMAAAAALAAIFERWRRHQAEKKAEERIAAVKIERNQHAERAQRLEVEVASLRPPPLGTSSSQPPGEMEGDP